MMHELFQQTSFNAEEMTVVWQSINVEHNCHYCVPAHSGIATSMKIDQDIVDALVNKTPLASSKLKILRETTLAVTRERGVISDTQIALAGIRTLRSVVLWVASRKKSLKVVTDQEIRDQQNKNSSFCQRS